MGSPPGISAPPSAVICADYPHGGTPMEFDFARFSSILVNSISDAVIFADAKGLIQFWNRGAERIFGFAQAEALGQSLDIIIPENLRRRHWDGFDKTMRTGESLTRPGPFWRCPPSVRTGHESRSNSQSYRSTTKPDGWLASQRLCGTRQSDLKICALCANRDRASTYVRGRTTTR
jgi:PAS domain-containing protein